MEISRPGRVPPSSWPRIAWLCAPMIEPWPNAFAPAVMTSGGPAYALLLRTNARGPAHAPFLNNESRSVYFSPRDGCSLGGWARRPLLSLETRARQFTRACCNYVWWPSVRTFLRYECTGPGARSFSSRSQSVSLGGWARRRSFLLNCGGRQES